MVEFGERGKISGVVHTRASDQRGPSGWIQLIQNAWCP